MRWFYFSETRVYRAKGPDRDFLWGCILLLIVTAGAVSGGWPGAGIGLVIATVVYGMFRSR